MVRDILDGMEKIVVTSPSNMTVDFCFVNMRQYCLPSREPIVKEQSKCQIVKQQKIEESKKVIDFSTIYRVALKVLQKRKGVIDGLKDK
jgi:hypothetical protein